MIIIVLTAGVVLFGLWFFRTHPVFSLPIRSGSMCYSPDGSMMITPEFDGITGWNAINGERIGHLDTPNGTSECALSPDGRYLATTTLDSNQVTIRDTVNWLPVTQVISDGEILGLTYTPDNRYLITVSHAIHEEGVNNTNRIEVWETPTYQKVHEFAWDIENVVFELPMALSRDGNFLAVAHSYGDDYGLVQVFDIRNFVKETQFEVATWIWDLAWSPNGNFLAIGGRNIRLQIWNVFTEDIQVIEHHFNGTVSAVAYSADGSHLITSGFDQSIRLWRTDTWETVFELWGAYSGSYASDIVFSPNSDYFAISVLGREARTMVFSMSSFNWLPR